MDTSNNGTSNGNLRSYFDPLKILTTSGDQCPCDGIWETVGKVKTTAILTKGQITPTYLGKKVAWKLIKMG